MSARGRAAPAASCCRRWCRACAAVSFFAPRAGVNECNSDVVLPAAAQDARRNIRHGDFLQQLSGPVVYAILPGFLGKNRPVQMGVRVQSGYAMDKDKILP